MALSQEERDALAMSIARAVPEQLLASVVQEGGVCPDFSTWQKIADDQQRGRQFGLASLVVNDFDQKDALQPFIAALYHRVYWDPDFLRRVSPYVLPPDSEPDQREVFYRRRDSLIDSGLMSNLIELAPRVCCIAGHYTDSGNVDQNVRGTGFLVAPDLILTAYHVVAPFVDAAGNGVENPKCAAFFDYCDEPLLKDDEDTYPHMRRVAFASRWLELYRGSLKEDGSIDPRLDPAYDEKQKQYLDFALIRLSEPVGLGALSTGGGRRRGWMDLLSTPSAVQKDARVIIIQHPGGEPRKFDFGRLQFESSARQYYDTETADGTSGAPCLARDLSVIAIHNASLAQARLNQGVRIDIIEPLINDRLNTAQKIRASDPEIWNVASSSATIEVIIGRQPFLNWLAQAVRSPVTARSGRCYAVAGPSGSGKSFTLKILRRYLAQEGRVPLVAFGPGEQVIPPGVEDMIRVLADTLGIPAGALDNLPLRPQRDLRAQDGDKKNVWASETVPRWFQEKLDQFRTVDRRSEAKLEIAARRSRREAIPVELEELAMAERPVLETREGTDCWIVLDGLVEAPLGGEIRDLIAGLCGAGSNEAALHPALRRLRWVFLGYRPDFIESGGVTVELLDPTEVSPADLSAVLYSAWMSSGFLVDQKVLTAFQESVNFAASSYDTMELSVSMRLKFLQNMIGRIVQKHLSVGGYHELRWSGTCSPPSIETD